ncbi:MAG: membrane protein insertase YidC [Acutalibacter sp.]|nr:membrane protein insertase YidC [Acutalibacter sp.]
MGIFNVFGSILGYLLWFLYTIFRNYGIAIILFTIVLKIALFPTSLKQQRSMASQSKLSEKQKELQKKYANNRQKYNEELSKLYEKEGVNPTSGCLTTLLPFPIMLGIYYSVIMPLSNTLHIASETVQKATDYISKIPGMTSTGGIYSELQIIRNFSAVRENLTMFSQADLAKIEDFSKGFKFLGLDLLSTPRGAAFSTLLWLIPVLSFLSSFAFQIYTMIYQKKTTGQNPQGCMLVLTFVFPFLSLWWAYTMPAAVGFYWITSSLTSWAQSLVTNRYFSAAQMTAKIEAQRAVTLELAEAAVRPLPAAEQKKIADRLSAGQNQQEKNGAKQDKNANKQGKNKKKSGSGPSDSNAYIGTKK